MKTAGTIIGIIALIVIILNMKTIVGTFKVWLDQSSSTSVDLDKLNHQVDSLNTIIANEAKNRAENAKIITSLKDSLVAIEQQLESNDQRLKNLKKDYEKKLADINNFSSNDIERYFTARYSN